MATFSTKLKIILVAFAIIVGLYVIQSLITTVGRASKRESFKDGIDDEDELPNEKTTPKKKNDTADKDVPAPKTKEGKDSKEKSTTDDKEPNDTDLKKATNKEKDSEDVQRKKEKDLKFQILECVENAFAKNYKEHFEEKSAIFGMLLQKENFQELKERYNNGQPIRTYVENFISKVVDIDRFENKSEEAEPKKGNNEDKGIDIALEKVEKHERETKLQRRLDEVMDEVSRLQFELAKLKEDDTKGSARNAAAPAKKPEPKSSPKEDVIEGFENRINYASY